MFCVRDFGCKTLARPATYYVCYVMLLNRQLARVFPFSHETEERSSSDIRRGGGKIKREHESRPQTNETRILRASARAGAQVVGSASQRDCGRYIAKGGTKYGSKIQKALLFCF